MDEGVSAAAGVLGSAALVDAKAQAIRRAKAAALVIDTDSAALSVGSLEDTAAALVAALTAPVDVAPTAEVDAPRLASSNVLYGPHGGRVCPGCARGGRCHRRRPVSGRRRGAAAGCISGASVPDGDAGTVSGALDGAAALSPDCRSAVGAAALGVAGRGPPAGGGSAGSIGLSAAAPFRRQLVRCQPHHRHRLWRGCVSRQARQRAEGTHQFGSCMHNLHS